MKCALVFNDEGPKKIITDEEIDCEPNSALVDFSVYKYQGICENMV